MTDITPLRQAMWRAAAAVRDAKHGDNCERHIAVISNNDEIERTQRLGPAMHALLDRQRERAFDSLRLAGYLTSNIEVAR